MWRERELIDVTWMDRLARPYLRLLAADRVRGGESPRREEFPWDLLLLRAGGVVLVVATLLWPALYWEHLGPVARVTAVAVPVTLLNLVGWWAHRHGNLRGAVAFLSVGTPLVPLGVLVLLTETGAFEASQGPLELLDGAGRSDVLAPTNLQITLAAAAMTAWSVLTLRVVRARAFAAWLGVSIYLLLGGLLLLLGLRPCFEEAALSGPLLLVATAAFGFVPFARALRSSEDGRWSDVLYGFFPIPYAAAMTALALAGVRQASGRPAAEWTDAEVQHWLMMNTGVYLIAAYRCGSADVSFARYWAPFFLAIVPASLIVPANVLFADPPFLFDLGSRPFTIYEAVAALVSVACLAVGTRLRRRTLLVSGLASTALFVVRASLRHFEDDVSWPLALALGGAATLATGAALPRWRTRRDSDAPE